MGISLVKFEENAKQNGLDVSFPDSLASRLSTYSMSSAVQTTTLIPRLLSESTWASDQGRVRMCGRYKL